MLRCDAEHRAGARDQGVGREGEKDPRAQLWENSPVEPSARPLPRDGGWADTETLSLPATLICLETFQKSQKQTVSSGVLESVDHFCHLGEDEQLDANTQCPPKKKDTWAHATLSDSLDTNSPSVERWMKGPQRCEKSEKKGEHRWDQSGCKGYRSPWNLWRFGALKRLKSKREAVPGQVGREPNF